MNKVSSPGFQKKAFVQSQFVFCKDRQVTLLPLRRLQQGAFSEDLRLCACTVTANQILLTGGEEGGQQEWHPQEKRLPDRDSILETVPKFEEGPCSTAGQEIQNTHASLILGKSAPAEDKLIGLKQARPMDIAEEESRNSKRHHSLHQPAEEPAQQVEPIRMQNKATGGASIVTIANAALANGKQAEISMSGSVLPQQVAAFSGIQLVTASGKPIQQASKNLSRAANLFADILEELGNTGETDLISGEGVQLAAAASTAFQLTTASGKKLEVGKAALEKGRQIMAEIAVESVKDCEALGRSALKRTAAEMTASNPATPIQVSRGVVPAASIDTQAAKTSANVLCLSKDSQPALLHHRQGKTCSWGNLG